MDSDPESKQVAVVSGPKASKPAAPKRTKLRPLEHQIVDHLLTEGGTQKEIADRLGIRRETVCRVLARERVRAHLDREVRHRTAFLAAKAQRRIERLVDGAKSEYVQLEAAKDALDRARVGKDSGPVGQQVLIHIDLS